MLSSGLCRRSFYVCKNRPFGVICRLRHTSVMRHIISTSHEKSSSFHRQDRDDMFPWNFGPYKQPHDAEICQKTTFFTVGCLNTIWSINVEGCKVRIRFSFCFFKFPWWWASQLGRKFPIKGEKSINAAIMQHFLCQHDFSIFMFYGSNIYLKVLLLSTG